MLNRGVAMKLNFEPVTNRIGKDYFIVPKNDTEGIKCVMKCNEVGAFIVNCMYPDNKTRDELIALVSAQYPEATPEEVEAAVDGVRDALKKTVSKKEEAEVVTK